MATFDRHSEFEVNAENARLYAIELAEDSLPEKVKARKQEVKRLRKIMANVLAGRDLREIEKMNLEDQGLLLDLDLQIGELLARSKEVKKAVDNG